MSVIDNGTFCHRRSEEMTVQTVNKHKVIGTSCSFSSSLSLFTQPPPISPHADIEEQKKQKLFEVQLFLRIKQLTRPKEKGKSGSHGTKQQQANNYFQ